MVDNTFNPALIVVDLQEDFCPPNGTLAVAEGRAIVAVVNELLSRPRFVLRVATKDWHPPDHISFASNHPGKRPFVDFATVTNPLNPREPSYQTRLWPVHCVQNSPGAQLVPDLDVRRVDVVVEKGTHKDVEMYSAIYDPFTNPRVSDSGLVARLRAHRVTHVYVVGLAADYCVRSTALDALHEGFVTYIVEEGTRAVHPDAWPAERAALAAAGVQIVHMDSPAVAQLG
ncbi:hypothetical protein HMPREF1624_07391 [Sporothrix schenckii ATCC 58251]|uniref:nicotinamidase n=1 Tax=Sporothrix schenckii (strain ATCC 58251 / de Perez 2211183) TaxID=1391915 RepID=U7PLG9_SPOS1|nr:hypothetical protein HMPREF1624_07391 [Sporothrix schenckii ATCC 58251]